MSATLANILDKTLKPQATLVVMCQRGRRGIPPQGDRVSVHIILEALFIHRLSLAQSRQQIAPQPEPLACRLCRRLVRREYFEQFGGFCSEDHML